MVTILKQNAKGEWYCANCRMRQPYLRSSCEFCEYEFSNWASIVLKNFKEKENLILFDEEKIKNSR